jgi:hypothetical protein
MSDVSMPSPLSTEDFSGKGDERIKKNEDLLAGVDRENMTEEQRRDLDKHIRQYIKDNLEREKKIKAITDKQKASESTENAEKAQRQIMPWIGTHLKTKSKGIKGILDQSIKNPTQQSNAFVNEMVAVTASAAKQEGAFKHQANLYEKRFQAGTALRNNYEGVLQKCARLEAENKMLKSGNVPFGTGGYASTAVGASSYAPYHMNVEPEVPQHLYDSINAHRQVTDDSALSPDFLRTFDASVNNEL